MEEGWGRGALPVSWVRDVAAVSSIFKKEVLAYTDTTQRRFLTEKPFGPFWSLEESVEESWSFSNFLITIVNALLILSD